ncbi:protein of unknown function [Hyphomicrobium sp. 1Nfss2.1]
MVQFISWTLPRGEAFGAVYTRYLLMLQAFFVESVERLGGQAPGGAGSAAILAWRERVVHLRGTSEIVREAGPRREAAVRHWWAGRETRRAAVGRPADFEAF